MTYPFVLDQDPLTALVKQIKQVGADFLKIDTVFISFLIVQVGPPHRQ